MQVGIFGTGLMGTPIAVRLLTTKIPVVAYNRTEEKLSALQAMGAEVTTSPLTAINKADCLILMLTNSAAIKSVLLTENNLSSLSNRTIIQMGTIAPSESREIHDAVVAAGGEYLEAPVLGSIPEAKTGKLLVMVGARESQFQQWQSLLRHFSPEPRLIGPVGTAAALKLALNQLIAGLTETFALSLGFIQRQGVDVAQFMNILRESALYAPTFDKKLARMCDRNYANPNFPTKHLLKDTDLFLQQAREIGQDITGLAGIREIIHQAIVLGLADADYSAIYSAINPID